MRLITSALILAALISTGNLLNENEFTKEIADTLSSRVPEASVKIVGDLELEVTSPTGISWHYSLGNFFTEYSANPDGYSELIERQLAAHALAMRGGVNGNIDIDRIVPRIWSRESYESLHESIEADERSRIVASSINEELYVCYAIDDSLTITYMSMRAFRELETDLDVLDVVAVSNLRRILPAVKLHDFDGVHMITAGGDYEASLLLLDEIWRDDVLPVDGSYVVGVPARDMLLYTGSEDSAGIERIREIVRGADSLYAHPISEKLFIRQGDSWDLLESE